MLCVEIRGGGDDAFTTLQAIRSFNIVCHLVNLNVPQIYSKNFGKFTTHYTRNHCGLIFNILVRELLEDKAILM